MVAATPSPLVGNPHSRSVETLSPFASPDHLDQSLKAFLTEASERLCVWFASASQRGPLPPLRMMPEIAPLAEGRSAEGLLDDLQLVMEGAYQPSHPGAMAHLDPPPLTASIAADLICAGLNNNLLAEELSPSLSSLERQICVWFAERLGMPEKAGGVAASGGSLSNLIGLVVARQRTGLQNNPRAVVLASADAHVSMSKAVRVMGLAADALQAVPVDADGRIDLEQLSARIQALRALDRPCLAVVATAGTTFRGAVDPLAALGDLCTREGLWLHVDGAIGAAFGLPDSTAAVVAGINRADSITVNPQKLLGITKTSSLLLVADRADLEAAFATGLPYMEPAWGEEAHGGELGLQGSRSAEVLKLWLGLRQLGEQGIERLLQGALQRRLQLEQSLDSGNLRLLSGPLHLIACTPHNTAADAGARWSVQTRQILMDHQIMVSRPFYQGRHYLKIVLGNPHTQNAHLNLLAELLNHSMQGLF